MVQVDGSECKSMPSRMRLGVLVALVFVALNELASAQSPELRYQLGRRLTRFERQWQTADADERARSTPKMMAAVNSFFSLQLDNAILKLDEAWLAVSNAANNESAERPSDAGWFLSVRPLLVDADKPTLNLAFVHQPASATAPLSNSDCDLRAVIHNAAGTQVAERRWASVSNTDNWDWLMEPVAAGDYQVTATIHRENSATEVIANRFSVIAQLDAKMEWVRTQANGQRPAVNDTKRLSMQWIAKMILGAQDGRIAESDLPFASLLADLESLSRQQETVRDFIASRTERPIWLQLGNGKAKQHVRLQTAAHPKNAPLVVAFHGAGGSENMFFESYGAGALIDLCRDKGWSVISPRQSLMGLGMELDALLAELRVHLDFDPARVFLVGHSMGAAQAVAQVSKHPSLVRAVAALGGGGRPIQSKQLIDIPFLVAAGDKDFGLKPAKSLAELLQTWGVPVEFREVKDVEHMVIVQATLGEVIAFFETHNGIKDNGIK